MTAETKSCSSCHKVLNLARFGINSQQRSGLQPHCKPCHASRVKKWQAENRGRKNERSKEWYVENKERHAGAVRVRRLKAREFINALKAGACADCGEGFHPVAMDFHHVGGGKEKGVAQMLGYRLDRIAAEIQKCVLLCANCHRVRHFA